jgi:hypothetical protein
MESGTLCEVRDSSLAVLAFDQAHSGACMEEFVELGLVAEVEWSL